KSTRKPATACASNWSMTRRASRSRPRTKAGATKSTRASYIEVDDDELEAIQVESKHTVDIDSFVPAAQIDNRFYDTPCSIAPTDSVGQEAFAVIRDAMRDKGMVRLGRIVLAKRERVIALEPCGKGMLGTTLRSTMCSASFNISPGTLMSSMSLKYSSGL